MQINRSIVMKWREYWAKIPPYLRNKYSVTAIVFFLWMLYFDQNDFISQLQLRHEIYTLEQHKAYFQEEIEKTDADLKELLSDNQKLEKFAREKYFMKQPNEEIFVIVSKDE